MNYVEKTNMLDLYVISCHVDKPLSESIPVSKYDVNIQAGAANTELRTQPINDYDNFEGSISERNERYSEATAMYWIYRHISSKYVGISHYRRKFDITDEEIDKLLDENIDIITLKAVDLGQSIEEDYKAVLFNADWKLFLEILKKQSPGIYEFAEDYYAGELIHPCNMNIFRAELYSEFGDWAFPIMDEFYRRSQRKTDRYQRRDVGFIAERLSSLFVEKKRHEGFSIIEVPIKEIGSKHWKPEDECDLDDPEDVFAACCRLFNSDKITESKNIIGQAMRHSKSLGDDRIIQLSRLFLTAEYERLLLPRSMYEYLPMNWRKDLPTLLDAHETIGNIIKLINKTHSTEAVELLNQFISMTSFSNVVIYKWCKLLNADEKEILAVLK